MIFWRFMNEMNICFLFAFVLFFVIEISNFWITWILCLSFSISSTFSETKRFLWIKADACLTLNFEIGVILASDYSLFTQKCC